MAILCKSCEKRIFGSNFTRCFGNCKKIICESCAIEHKCIDCFVESKKDFLIQDYWGQDSPNPQPND